MRRTTTALRLGILAGRRGRRPATVGSRLSSLRLTHSGWSVWGAGFHGAGLRTAPHHQSGRADSGVQPRQWMEYRRHRTGPGSDEIPRRRRTGLVRDHQADLDCGTGASALLAGTVPMTGDELCGVSHCGRRALGPSDQDRAFGAGCLDDPSDVVDRSLHGVVSRRARASCARVSNRTVRYFPARRRMTRSQFCSVPEPPLRKSTAGARRPGCGRSRPNLL
jgi:hypothetical protein